MTASVSERFEIIRARHDRACRALYALVRQLERIGGYMTTEQQAELREARAVLAEADEAD